MLKIITVPAEILSSPTKQVSEINERIKKLVKEMEKTLAVQNDPMGVGLAANQVGVNLSMFIIKPNQKAKIKVFINPRIIKSKIQNPNDKINPKSKMPGEKSAAEKKPKRIKLEGCLSIPRIWGPVKRSLRVLLNYQDIDGRRHLKWFSGFEAMIIQHEVDHLKGITFTQRALEQKRQLYREENNELVKIDNL